MKMKFQNLVVFMWHTALTDSTQYTRKTLGLKPSVILQLYPLFQLKIKDDILSTFHLLLLVLFLGKYNVYTRK